MRPEIVLRTRSPLKRWFSLSLLLIGLYALSLMIGISKMARFRITVRRQLLPVHDELVYEHMPRVVLIFLTMDGTDLVETWNNWYNSWLIYLENHGAKRDIKPDGSNPYLKGVLFSNKGFDEEYVQSRSPVFVQNWIVPDPVEANRFQLLNATRQAFGFALESHPDATHYSYISDTTIPVKPFSTIWGQLAADTRSKIDLFCAEHREGFPKHSQWLTLRKKHAEALVDDHPVWKAGANTIVRGTCPTLCGANDEYWPIRIITENLNYTSTTSWKSEFDVRTMLHPLGTINWRTFVDWQMFSNRDYTKAVGKLKDTHVSHPGTFEHVSGRFLRMLVATENTWFARKMPGDMLPIVNCNDHPLEIWGNALGGELRSSKRAYQSPSKIPFDFGPLINCTLVDFVSTLLEVGPWAPIVHKSYPTYLKGYVTQEEDEPHISRGGLFVVRYANGTRVPGGLDLMLAGSLKGSHWSNGTGLVPGVSVELRPLLVTALDSHSEVVEKNIGLRRTHFSNLEFYDEQDTAIFEKMRLIERYSEEDL